MGCEACGCQEDHPTTKLDYEKLAEELNKFELHFSGLVLDRHYESRNPQMWFTRDENVDGTPYYLEQDEHGHWEVKEDNE